MSDSAIIKMIGEFIKHHRIDQNRTQGDLAEDAGVSRSTLSLLERGQKVNVSSLIQVLRVLGLLHIFSSFKIQQQISPMLLAEINMNKRKRASKKKGKSSIDNYESDW